MASTLYSEAPASRLTISLENAATASPFPSPSSSFLTPPTPGAHEFAMKPPPSVRPGRKGSVPLNRTSNNTSPATSPRSSTASSISSKSDNGESQSKRSSYANGLQQPTSITSRASNAGLTNIQASPSSCDSPTGSLSDLSSNTPTLPVSPPVIPAPGVDRTDIPPSSSIITTLSDRIPSTDPALDSPHLQVLTPIQVSASPIDDASLSTCGSLEVPPSSSSSAPRPRTNLVSHGSRPISTASTTSTTSHNSVGSSASAFDPALLSSRPAPPSPGGGSTLSLSRKPSTRWRTASNPVSRANSLRTHRGSSHVSSPIGPSPAAPTLAMRGDGAATPHNQRVSTGSQLHGRTFSSSSLASPTKAHFDMGISASSPAIQNTAAPSSIATTISSEGSSLSPSTTSTSVSTTDPQLQPPPLSQQDEHKVFVKIRDFAFQPADERHNGQGPLVPKTNKVGRMNRRLGGRSYSTSSMSSSDGDGAEEEEDEDDGWGWNAGGYGARGFGFGVGWGGGGRFSSWTTGSGAGAATAATIFDQEKAYAAAAANLSGMASKPNGNASDGYPSRSDMDLNFLDSESEEFYDAEDMDDEEGVGETSVDGEEDDDDEPLYPGLYRALYAFEPEGTAEMRLVEDQIVRIVGRGGGVGWAVAVAEPEEGTEMDPIVDGAFKTKHALVPESYLEPYKLD